MATTNTKLELVNTILDVVGEDRVQTLDGSPAAEMAETRLDYLKRLRLSNKGLGWTFNRVAFNAVPDVNGQVRIGTKLLKVIADRPGITVRNGLLYDLVADTTFNIDLPNLEVLLDLDYDDLPHEFNHMLMLETCLYDQISTGMSQAEKSDVATLLSEARDEMKRYELLEVLKDPKTAPMGNPSVYGAMSRRIRGQLL